MSDDNFPKVMQAFEKLDATLSLKALRPAMRDALKPTTVIMVAKAPKGTKAHRTYKGRLVSPGFLTRRGTLRILVKRSRGSSVGVLDAIVGVKAEAFYGPQFFDKGVVVRKRRRPTGRMKRGKRVLEHVALKQPYSLHGSHWFRDVFVGDRDNIAHRFVLELGAQIRKVLK